MRWQVSYLLLIIFTLILLGAVFAYGWRFRHARGAKYFLAFSLGAFVWTALVGLTSVSPPQLARTWIMAKYFVIAFEPMPVLLFVLSYTGRERWIRPWLIGAAGIVPAVTQFMVWTNNSHHLMLRSLVLVEEEGFTYLQEISFGPWYWVHALHGYVMILASAGLMALGMVRASPLMRRQGLAIFAGVLAPMFANVTLLTGLAPREIDPMPFGLAITAVLFGWGGFGQRLLDLVPVARSALVEAVREGMLVLDGEGRIIDMNPAMAEALGVSPPDVMGKFYGRVIEGRGNLAGLLEAGPGVEASGRTGEIRIGEREFEGRVIGLGASGWGGSARLLVLSEQTQRKRMEREQQQLIAELRDALGQVKTLRGMLPLCASCKKVRDDAGYWHQVDVYIRDHSEAQISHGICPECQSRLYPEYAGKLKG